MSTSIRGTSPFSLNSHMSLNRIYCDSRCTCFPVELEQQHIAIAPRLMHKSLPTTPRPSPDRKRCLLRLCCSKLLPATTPELNFHLNWLSQKEEQRNGSKGRSSSVRLSLRQPHYRRQFVIVLRLAALRPALSLRYALIGESDWKERNPVNSPAGAGSEHRANIRPSIKQELCQPFRQSDNIRFFRKLAAIRQNSFNKSSRFFRQFDAKHGGLRPQFDVTW